MTRWSTALVPLVLVSGCYAGHGGREEPVDSGGEPDAAAWVEVAITDTLGWTLTMSYAPVPPHVARSEAELPHPIDCPEEQRSEGTIQWHGRMLLITARCSGRYYEIMPRPVVCEASADCEGVRGWLLSLWPDGDQVPSRYECVRGLCQHPEQPIRREDLYALCLVDTPRWRDFESARSDESGYPALHDLVGDHCREGTCVVPESCRQP
jgi:hypothetical protein